MKYCQDTCYMTLVRELQERYRQRNLQVSKLLQERDLAGIQRRNGALREAFRARLEDPAISMPELRVRQTGTIEFPDYRIEKLVLNSAREMLIPVHLYLPLNGAGRHPAVIVLVGHWMQGKQMEEHQRLCANLAKKGIAAIIFDPIYQGERLPCSGEELDKMFPGASEDIQMVGLHMFAGNLAYLLGRNIGALFVSEARRVLDYLLSRPQIDPSRIGAVGQSGGGTQACYLAALEKRIQAYAPVQCLSSLSLTLADGIGDCEQSLNGISQEEGVEQWDILWAAMPKPVLHSAARQDFFCVEGVYAIEKEMTKLYDILGEPHGYTMQLADGGHRLSAQSRSQLYGWLTKHFLGQENACEAETELLDETHLRCLEKTASVGNPADVYQAIARGIISRRPDRQKELKEKLRRLLAAPDETYTVETLSRTAVRQEFVLHTLHHRSIFCRLINRASGQLLVTATPDDSFLRDCKLSVLSVTPWAIETAYQKEHRGYDLETCLFNAAAVLGENLAVDRVVQIQKAIEYACTLTGAWEVFAVGDGAGSLPILLTACIEPKIRRTVLSRCRISFDDLFACEDYFLTETDIAPDIFALADIPQLCRLAGANVLRPLHADRRPYTPEEIRQEKRVSCVWSDGSAKDMNAKLHKMLTE